MSATTPTLYDIMLGAFDELCQLVSGVATGGSTTTLVDSGLKGRDDDWVRGTAFLTYDAAGAGAAPEGQFSEVTSYARATGTLTTVWTAAPASGDYYSIATKRWGTDDMRQIVNRALVRMGDIAKVDVSLTTASATSEYSLPAAAKGKLRRVYLQRNTTADNEEPEEMTDWYVENDILIFRRRPESGKVLRLVSMGPHARLNAYGDALDPSVHINRIVAEAAYVALRLEKRQTQGEDRSQIQDLNDAAEHRDAMRKAHPLLDPGTPFKPLLHPDNTRRKNRRWSRRRHGGEYVP